MQLDEEVNFAKAGFNFLQAMPCEATFYLYIKKMCYPKNYCEVSHTDMCKFFNVSRETISQWKESLEKKGFIRKETAKGKKTKLYPIFEKNLKTSQEKLTSSSVTSQEKLTSSSVTSQEKLTSSSQEKLTSSSQEKLTSDTLEMPGMVGLERGRRYLIDNNIDISLIDAEQRETFSIEIEENGNEKKSSIPTINEVVIYAQEIGYSDEQAKDVASQFWNYYNAAGWHDSKGNLVKSWKQKVQAWQYKPSRTAHNASQTVSEATQEAQKGNFKNFFDEEVFKAGKSSSPRDKQIFKRCVKHLSNSHFNNFDECKAAFDKLYSEFGGV